MRISGLFVYPVKSCRGIALDEVEVGEQAFVNDRRFMVIQPEGKFITQGLRPVMAQIEASVHGDVVELDAPGRQPIRVEARTTGERQAVSLWGTPCEVVDQGDEVAAWLSEILETPARLVAMAAGYERPVHEKLPRAYDGRLIFADAAPILVISEASLDELNDRLDTPLPMNRFRPNLVVSGCEPYAEDAWDRIRLGGFELARMVPCGRCSVTATDQATGERGEEPLRTLATYRKDETYGVMFGTYYGHLGTGRLAVGDLVEVMGAADAASA